MRANSTHFFVLAILFAAGLLGAPDQAVAELTGADLLKVCEYGLKSGFRGFKGKMCVWYVTPCNCDLADPTLPRVCLIEPIDARRLAIEVTEVLKAFPEWQSLEANAATAEILSVLYPCHAELDLRSSP